MNCPKCNSPLNEGDKFCQVCGSVVNNEPQQPAVEPAPAAPQPAVQEVAPVAEAQPAPAPQAQPVVNNMPQQPAPMQPTNYNQPNIMPSAQPMSPTQPPKKNNTIVFVLIGIVAVLLVLVFVLLGTGDKEEEKPAENTPQTEVKDEETVEPVAKYTTTTVGGFKFKLPEGYYAELYEGEVVLYDEGMNFEAYVSAIDGNFDEIDKEGYKAYLTSCGLTNVTYSTKTVNGKNMLIFKADYSGYTVEYIYVKYNAAKITGASVVYEYKYDELKDEIYDIITNIEVEESSFSSTTGSKLPEIDMKNVLPKN